MNTPLFRQFQFSAPRLPFWLVVFTMLGIGVFLPIVSLVLLMGIVGFILIHRFRMTLIESLFLGLLCIFIGVITLYSVTSILHITLGFQHAFWVEACFITPLLWLDTYRQKRMVIRFVLCTPNDLAVLSGAVVTFVILCIPLQTSSARITRFLSIGEDNASHYSLVNYLTQSGTYAYTKNADSVGLIQSLEIYPQGFHASTAAVASLVHPKVLTQSRLLKIYAYFITFQFSLLLFWVIKVCLGCLKNSSRFVALSSLPAVVLLCGFGFLLLLLDRGFQPQVFAYVYLMAITYLLALPYDKSQALNRFYLALLLCVGIGTSWWLMLPIAGLMLLAYLWRGNLIKPLCKSLGRYSPLVIAIAFTTVYPILVGVLLSQKHNPLSESGGVNKINWAIFWYLSPVIMGGLICKSYQLRIMRFLGIGLAGSIIMAALVAMVQKATVGYFEYFFYKSIYTVLIFTFCLFFVSLIWIAQQLYDRLGKRLKYLVPVCILIGTFGFAVRTHYVYARVYVHGWTPNAVQIDDLGILYGHDSEQYQDVLFVADCVPGRDYASNRWTGARYLSTNNTRSRITTTLLFDESARSSKLLLKYAKKKQPILLVVGNTCKSKVQTLDQLKTLPGVTIQMRYN